jgi:hypothetical protein
LIRSVAASRIGSSLRLGLREGRAMLAERVPQLGGAGKERDCSER